MNLVPTPITAALAGAFSAVALPAATRWLGTGSDVGIELLLVFVVVVAVPAHLFVLGLRRPQTAAQAGAVDKPLLVRVGAWLAAAAVGSVVPLVVG